MNNSLIEEKVTPPLPPATLVDPFALYITQLMAGLPSKVKEELQEDILALVFAAKKKNRQKYNLLK